MRRGEVAVIAIALLVLGQVPGPRQVRVVGAVVVGAAVCGRIPGLAKGQRDQCRAAPHAMPAVGEGAALGLRECRHQFRHHRWNCSHVASDQVFGHVVVVGSREAAFTYAISSAGVTYTVTAACSRGNITACGCESAVRTSKELVPSGWQWGGCSADVTYGMRFARRFLDAREIEGDARSLMNLHNNKAGRKMVKALLQTECKCHGISGSCTVRTCWRKLPSFRQIGDALMKKYHRARPVLAITPVLPPTVQSFAGDSPPSDTTPILGNDAKTQGKTANDPAKSRRERRPRKKGNKPRRPHLVLKRPRPSGGPGHGPKRIPKRSELVFLQPSPNYCEPDLAHGSFGTQGRTCNRTSRDTDGCDLMCCGRGYNTHQYTKVFQCRCKFHWCCLVKCDTCTDRIEEYTCK
ncbi:protein Wnt-2 isoform X1 [Neodiprion pinetum]|uniref:protein Wnt-2 isoform X1 n=1 Tax=Neodiprion pinetum TaxID=441929 RepID=UPI001EDEE4E4|nr:protein Wnt-7b isoform X1 [Neodiprion pinetum]XP_046482206.1 protein Wnt-7b isoform X1 [Neodiprion pinetum]XP_046482214.1 protein Wnt-7b isoform X1 [Neodiprion pinetum]XP_046482223.1 protein Wnt-7b isoform X1 [Neodiprion pinetum]XP_046482233.1 protein Wnt-7b isoform X1 [Neodiprion pinetum]